MSKREFTWAEAKPNEVKTKFEKHPATPRIFRASKAEKQHGRWDNAKLTSSSRPIRRPLHGCCRPSRVPGLWRSTGMLPPAKPSAPAAGSPWGNPPTARRILQARSLESVSTAGARFCTAGFQKASARCSACSERRRSAGSEIGTWGLQEMQERLYSSPDLKVLLGGCFAQKCGYERLAPEKHSAAQHSMAEHSTT